MHHWCIFVRRGGGGEGGLGGLLTEGAYSLNRKSSSKQALVVLIKTCFAFTGFYCAFYKHANSGVQKPTDDCVLRCRES